RRRAGWFHWQPLHQEPTSAPPVSLVFRPETLCQGSTSAPAASWVLRPATLCQDPGLGAGGELGGSTGTTSPGTNLGTAGAFGVSARNTLPRIDLGADGYQLLPLKRNRKMCDSIVYAPMDELEFERLLGLATLFNDNDEWPIDFTELQELSELLGKLKSCVDVAIDNAPEAAKS
ncbi:hypothetical protein, partial [Pseudomonas aeruginosa]|uniref:hypothetical protein n=1 Tax=Pseudomonas aeruginosa TaxID=287 RepID=UPI001E360FED